MPDRWLFRHYFMKKIGYPYKPSYLFRLIRWHLRLLYYFFLLPFISLNAQTGNFPPPEKAPIVYAVKTSSPVVADGKLDEAIWQTAPVISDFFRIEPRQGGKYLYETRVQIVYDDKNLYVGAFCRDSLGKSGTRVQDMRRDFAWGENDIFYVQLDPQNLKRYCVSFQTTPYGNQRDKQVFDDRLNDQDWDALWRVRTNITDSGWYAEFAIPFKSLRYDKPQTDSVSWGITLGRLARRDYENTVFPAIPQSFSAYRMTYAAQLKGLSLPPPGINIRINPYGLFQTATNTNNSGQKTTQNEWKAGGEVKWAVNPSTVVDLTFNTDFAQADVDRAVNNLTRFNIFFPERRQFFLENNGVYAGTNVQGLNPYFSRTIGLADAAFNAEPVPIDVGARYTDRTMNRTWAGMYVRQQATEFQGAANFGLARYLKNYGSQNNAGAMLTYRLDEGNAESGFEQKQNTTFTFDGLIRPKNTWTISYLASVSGDKTEAGDSMGTAGHVSVEYSGIDYYGQVRTRFVSQKYHPGMGLVFQNNVIWNNAAGFKITRPKGKLGKYIRRIDSGVWSHVYHDATTFAFQSANLDFFPLYTVFADNSVYNFSYEPAWEYYFFNPLGISVKPGEYMYHRFSTRYNSDASKKVSGYIRYEWGEYYDGRLNIWRTGFRVAPIPHIAATFDYEQQQIRDLGINKISRNNDLYTFSLRLAWNPRIQASAFYQYNSFNEQGRWNVRGSWEFAPLSFLFIVFNETQFNNSPVHNQSVINKVSFMKQF